MWQPGTTYLINVLDVCSEWRGRSSLAVQGGFQRVHYVRGERKQRGGELGSRFRGKHADWSRTERTLPSLEARSCWWTWIMESSPIRNWLCLRKGVLLAYTTSTSDMLWCWYGQNNRNTWTRWGVWHVLTNSCGPEYETHCPFFCWVIRCKKIKGANISPLLLYLMKVLKAAVDRGVGWRARKIRRCQMWCYWLCCTITEPLPTSLPQKLLIHQAWPNYDNRPL